MVRLRVRFSFGLGGRRFPFLKRRADARPALSFLSDARPADDLLRGNAAPPEVGLLARVRVGTIVAGLVVLFVFGVAISIFGARGYRDVQQGRREFEDLRARLDAQQDRVTALKREVQRLREDPGALERIAREELGYAKPGEVIFLLPGEEPVGTIRREAPRQREFSGDGKSRDPG